ncbi:MAG: CNNM domain-containing protein [Verrucomicrobiae bacterium]|nr:CNNM domain-containing protein [Verrucomicrobiae bacterium]
MIISFIIIVCVILSFFFAGMETGALLLNRARLRHMREKGSVGARILLEFLHNPGRLSATVLVGKTLASAIATVLIAREALLHGGLPMVFIEVFLFALAFWFFGELVPTALFRRLPNKLTSWLAPLLLVTYVALYLLVRIFDFGARAIVFLMGGKLSSRQMFVTREELKLMAREGEHSLPLSGEQRRLIAAVLDQSGATAENMMKPRRDVLTVKNDSPIHDRLALAVSTGRSRFPLETPSGKWEELWVAYDTLFNTHHPSRLPLRIPAKTTTETIFAEMHKAKTPLAIVTDDNHNDIGIVTIEDVLRRYLGQVEL